MVYFILGKWFLCRALWVRKSWPEWVKMRSRDNVLHNVRG